MSVFEAVWKSLVLGTVQGLTEFLPVSSSGHLTLLQEILGYEIGEGGKMFVNILLHFGTLLAVFFAFWRDILALFKKPYKTLLMLIVATVPAGVVGVLFNSKIEALFEPENNVRWLACLAIFFAFTALMLLVCELVTKHRKKSAPLGWKSALPMGIFQAVALFPGISRSGSTITAGCIAGAKTEDVAKFSFLMSIPVILGSVVMELKDIVFPAEGVSLVLGTAEIVGMLVGVVFAALSGFFAIKVMIKVIGKANYKWFSLYLVLLSLTCFWLDVLGILV